jgi:hypothetical protein
MLIGSTSQLPWRIECADRTIADARADIHRDQVAIKNG